MDTHILQQRETLGFANVERRSRLIMIIGTEKED